MVKLEIEQRRLETDAVHVVTADEKAEAEQMAGLFNFVRLFSALQALIGFGFALIGFVTMFQSSARPSDRMFSVALSGVSILLGVLLVAFAVGVWKGRRWAFTSGMVINAALGSIHVMGLFMTSRAGEEGAALVSLIPILICAGFVSAYYKLRQKSA